jgi:hypothetical protein
MEGVLVFVSISIRWLVRRFSPGFSHGLASSSARLGLLLGEENDWLLYSKRNGGIQLSARAVSCRHDQLFTRAL